MATPAEILASFPEFVDPPADQALYLTLAEERTADVEVWSSENVRNQAVAFRAAGMMADLGLVGSAAASTGAVSSERIGSLAVSYAVPGAGENPLSNGYWRQLQQLIAENIMAPMTSYG